MTFISCVVKYLQKEVAHIKPWAHFKTITKHKWYVLQYCFRAGLYWQGLTHDLSKFSPVEFMVGAKYYQGDHSPNDEERRDKGYSSAWLHHKGRNKHHLEYWIDYKSTPEGVRIAGMRMPEKYVVEMFCDRIAASRVYKGSNYDRSAPLEYFLHGKSVTPLHEDSAALLETLLTKLRDEGEDAVFQYIRKEVLKNKK